MAADVTSGATVFSRIRMLLLAFGSLALGVIVSATIVIQLKNSWGLILPVVPAAIIAGVIAMLVGWRLLPGWWRPLLAAAPLGLVSLLYISPWWYLVAAVVLGAVQWNAIATRIPLYRSDAAVARILVDKMQSAKYRRFMDLGCGDGRLLMRMAIASPEADFVGIESAPLLYLIARWRCQRQGNCKVLFGNFWKLDWSEYDLVFCFLSPEPMLRVWRKASREMPAEGSLMSLAFEVPGIDESECIETPSFDLFIYRHSDLQKDLSKQRDEAEGNASEVQTPNDSLNN